MARITPAKKPKPTKTIMFNLVSIQTDPTQYKPYAPTLQPYQPLLVEIPVDESEMTSPDTITLDGLMSILRSVSTAIDTMHHDRQVQIQQIYNKR